MRAFGRGRTLHDASLRCHTTGQRGRARVLCGGRCSIGREDTSQAPLPIPDEHAPRAALAHPPALGFSSVGAASPRPPRLRRTRRHPRERSAPLPSRDLCTTVIPASSRHSGESRNPAGAAAEARKRTNLPRRATAGVWGRPHERGSGAQPRTIEGRVGGSSRAQRARRGRRAARANAGAGGRGGDAPSPHGAPRSRFSSRARRGCRSTSRACAPSSTCCGRRAGPSRRTARHGRGS